MMDELTDWSHAVVLGNDSRETKEVTYRVWDDTGQTYIEGNSALPPMNIVLGHIRELAGRQKLYLITWQTDGQAFGNHYISGYPAYEAAHAAGWTKIAALPNPLRGRYMLSDGRCIYARNMDCPTIFRRMRFTERRRNTMSDIITDKDRNVWCAGL